MVPQKDLFRGKTLKTKEADLLEKNLALEKKVLCLNFEFTAKIDDFRIVVPLEGYPSYSRAPEIQDLPGNHLSLGLFGRLRYWVRKDNLVLDEGAIMNQRLAHLHYPYPARPVMIDIGQDQYCQLLRQLKTKDIPAGCQPENLFRTMTEKIREIGERYLQV